MDVFGIIGFIFGLSAFSKIIKLEKKLKDSGIIKTETESEKNTNSNKN
ncbi:MAG: hypothetical protein H8E60_01015 [Candidatus Marinimicrobia bacterium]|nr:hypothetical protein [Candidatus Neomarinimicrobiota bacterium]